MADYLDRYRGLFSVVLVAALLGGLALWWERKPPKTDLVIATPASQSATERRLIVDVAGAVARPGLYTLAEGARVGDAIAAAGGETPDADLARVNRALKLRDEQQLRIPRLALEGVNSATAMSSTSRQEPAAASTPIDINAATEAELDTLPGIGPATAQHILAYRRDHGPFLSVEQLRDAKLVNGPTFERIKGLIAVQ